MIKYLYLPAQCCQFGRAAIWMRGCYAQDSQAVQPGIKRPKLRRRCAYSPDREDQSCASASRREMSRTAETLGPSQGAAGCCG